MASISRHPDGRWRARYRDSDGHQHARHFARKVDGQRWLDEVAGTLHDGTHVDPRRGRVTFGTWVAQWRAESVHLKPKTVAGYDSILAKHVLPRFGETAIAKIDKPEVKRWIAELFAAGVTPGTAKNILNCAKAVFTSAVEGGAIKVNPAAGIKLPPRKRNEMMFLDADEVLRLSDSIDPQYETLVLVAAYTGLRAGELAALRWPNVNVLRGTIDVVESYAEVHGKLVLGLTKNYENRTVKLPRFLCDRLGAVQPRDDVGLVFRTAAGTPIVQSAFYRQVYKPAVREAGLPEKLRFHDLRHTAVALLIAQGAHPMAIKERLGHSSIVVTMDTYGHLFPSADEALVTGLDATYTGSVSRQVRTI